MAGTGAAVANAIGAAGSLLSGSSSTGGSVNSAQNVSNSQSHGEGYSRSYSQTGGYAASMLSKQFAAEANAAQQEFFNQAKDYNSKEAALQRAFQQINADTIYSRSVQDMIKAGINPILAASFGLSAANVGSGASASISTPSSHMAQAYVDSTSSAESSWNNDSWSHGEGSSSGSSWMDSTSGLMEGMSQIANAFENGLNAISNAKLFDINIGGKTGKEVFQDTTQTVKEGVKGTLEKITGFFKDTKDKVKKLQSNKL